MIRRVTLFVTVVTLVLFGLAGDVRAQDIEYEQPTLSVPIPTIKFSDITVTRQVEQGTERRVLDVPWLAEYLNGVYQYAIGMATIIAAVMMMVGGFQYLMAGGDATRVAKGKEKIKNAILGLFLTLSAYLILRTVNPELTTMTGLQVELVRRIEFPGTTEGFEREEESVDDTGVSATTATVKGDNVFGAKSTVPANLAPLLEKVAEDMADEGYGIHISSGVRAISKQVELIKKNCQNPPGSRTCNPKSTCGKTGTSKCPITCMMYNKDAPGVSPNPGTCPHTAGAAVDVWGVKLEEKSTSGWVSCFPDPKESWTVQCKNKSSCNNECQQKLYEIMEKHGFCLWSGEGWHFEKPGKSGNCRGHQ